MPELPDLTVYLEALAARVGGARLERIRLANPFVLRSVDPPPTDVAGRAATGLRRLGKRIVIALEGERFVLIHLMIAGRLHWKDAGAKLPGKIGLAALDFSTGTVTLTEAGSKRRAAIHLVRGEAALAAHDPGGLELGDADAAAFRAAITRESHTLKRTLTDPRILSGIGNAYSDEILHRARLSPVRMTRQLSEEESTRLFEAAKATLADWIERLRREAGGAFPEGVTAFRPDMAVHGRYGHPCPDCGAPVQRIVHAENETNYCARCQTAGRLLADRALSRLLHRDWPRTLEEMEERRPAGAAAVTSPVADPGGSTSRPRARRPG
ncbi:MAG TPA: DNA-formamidopyrimidine glycosylase family protein [Candidatus Limnocylindria bacterium]|nr:DNA-formamidopyrimidine glycosylase family protein [Candidatus Limnocylindria bacterium]